MGETTSVNLRIDKDLKKQAETLFSNLGINMTTAMNIFLKQAVREQALPFKVTAHTSHDDIPAYKGNANSYSNYEDFVASSLQYADTKVAEGKMKYYTADEIISGLEEVLNAKI